MKREEKTSALRDTPDTIHLTSIYCVPNMCQALGLGILLAKAR